MSRWSLDLSGVGKANPRNRAGGGRPRPVTRARSGGVTPNSLASNWLQKSVFGPDGVKNNPVLFGFTGEGKGGQNYKFGVPVSAPKPKPFKFLDDQLVKQFYASHLGIKNIPKLTSRQQQAIVERSIKPNLAPYMKEANQLNVDAQRASKDGVLDPKQYVSAYDIAAREASGWKKELFKELGRREREGAAFGGDDRARRILAGQSVLEPGRREERDWGDKVTANIGLDALSGVWRDVAHAAVVSAGGEGQWRSAVRSLNQVKAGGLAVMEQYARMPRAVQGAAIEEIKALKGAKSAGDALGVFVGLPALKGVKGGLIDNNANYGGGQFLNQFGVTGKVAGVGGLVLDVLGDPLTYVSGGTSAVAKAAQREGALRVAKNAGIKDAMAAAESKIVSERAAAAIKNAHAGIDEALERKLTNVEKYWSERGKSLTPEHRDRLIGQANRKKEQVSRTITERELQMSGLGKVGSVGKFRSSKPYEFPLARTAAAAAGDAAYTRAAWKSPVTRVTYGGKLVGENAKRDLFGLADGARGAGEVSGLARLLEKHGLGTAAGVSDNAIPSTEGRVASSAEPVLSAADRKPVLSAVDEETLAADRHYVKQINELNSKLTKVGAILDNPRKALSGGGKMSDEEIATHVRQARRQRNAYRREIKSLQKTRRSVTARNPVLERSQTVGFNARNFAAGKIAAVRPASVSSRDWELLKQVKATAEAEKNWGRSAGNRVANTFARRVKMSQYEDFMHVVEHGGERGLAKLSEQDRRVAQRVRSQVGLRDWDKQLLRQRRRAARRQAKAAGDSNWKNAEFDRDVNKLSDAERIGRDKYAASRQGSFLRDVVNAPNKAEFEVQVAKLHPEDQKFARDLRRSLSRAEAREKQNLLNKASVLRVHEGVMHSILGDEVNGARVGEKLSAAKLDELRLKHGPTADELKLVREYVASHGAQVADKNLVGGSGEVIEMLPGGRVRVALANAPVGARPVVATIAGKTSRAFRRLGPGDKVHVSASREGALELVAADDLSKARLNQGIWSQDVVDLVDRPVFDKLWELSNKDRLIVLDSAIAKRLELENPEWAGSRGMAQDTRNLMKYALRSGRAAGVGVVERSNYLPHLDLEHLNEPARAELMQRNLAKRAASRAAQLAESRLQRFGLFKPSEILAPLDETRFGKSGNAFEDVFGFTKARQNKGSITELSREIRVLPYNKRYLGASVNLPLVIDQYLKSVAHASAQMKMLRTVLNDSRLSKTLVTASAFEDPGASPMAVERARSMASGHAVDWAAARASVVDEEALWIEVRKALGKDVDWQTADALRVSVQQGLGLQQRLAMVEAELGGLDVPSLANALRSVESDPEVIQLWDKAASLASLRRRIIENADVYDSSAAAINDRLYFHGSQSSSFDKSGVVVTGVSDPGGLIGQGLHVTSKREVAFSANSEAKGYAGKGGNLMEGKLNVKNALDLQKKATPEDIQMLVGTAEDAINSTLRKLDDAKWMSGQEKFSDIKLSEQDFTLHDMELMVGDVPVAEMTIQQWIDQLSANMLKHQAQPVPHTKFAGGDIDPSALLWNYRKIWHSSSPEKLESLQDAARVIEAAVEKKMTLEGGFTAIDIERAQSQAADLLYESFRRAMWDRNGIDAVTHIGGLRHPVHGQHQTVLLLDPKYTNSIKYMRPSKTPLKWKSADRLETQNFLGTVSNQQEFQILERTPAGHKRFVYDTVVAPRRETRSLLERRAEGLRAQLEANLQARSDLLTGKNGLVLGMSAKTQSKFEDALGKYTDGIQSNKIEMDRQMEEWAAQGFPTDRPLYRSELRSLAKRFDAENKVHAEGLGKLSDDIQSAGQVQKDALGMLRSTPVLTDPARLGVAVRLQELTRAIEGIGNSAWFGEEVAGKVGMTPGAGLAGEDVPILNLANYWDDSFASASINFRARLASQLGADSEEVDALLKHLQGSLDDPKKQVTVLSQWNELTRQYLLETEQLPEFLSRRALRDGGAGLGAEYGFSPEFVRLHAESFNELGALLSESRAAAERASATAASDLKGIEKSLTASIEARKKAESLVRKLELELRGGKSIEFGRVSDPLAGNNIAYVLDQARKDLGLKDGELLTDEEFQAVIGMSGGDSLMFMHQPAGGGLPYVLSLSQAQAAITGGQRINRKWARVGSDREIEIARKGMEKAQRDLAAARKERQAVLDEIRTAFNGRNYDFELAVNAEARMEQLRQSLLLQRPLSESEVLNLTENVRRLLSTTSDWTKQPLSGDALPHLAMSFAKAEEKVAELFSVAEDATALHKAMQRFGWRDEFQSSYLTRPKQQRVRFNKDAGEKEIVQTGGLGGGKVFAMEAPVWEMLFADLAHPHFNGTNAYAKFVNGWKWLVTQAVPAFWVRNMVGDAQNSIMAQGALSYAGNMRNAWRVASYIRKLERFENSLNPGREMKESKSLSGSGSKWIDFKDKTVAGRMRRFNRLSHGRDITWGGWTVEDISRWAIEDGVANTGMTGRQWADVIHGADAAANSKLYRGGLRKRTISQQSDYSLDPAFSSKLPGVSERGVMDSLEQWSRFRENWGRINTYLGTMQQGADRNMAARQVTKHHFDYGDLSKTEHTLRNYFIPFYTWNSRNTGLWAAALVQKPGIIANFQMARQEAAHAAGLPVNYENDLALNEQLTFPIPVKIGNQVYLSSMGAGGLPISGINYGPGGFLASGEGFLRIPGVGAPGVSYSQQLLDWGMGMLSPVYKIPIEKLTGYSFYLHGQFAPDYRPIVPAPAWVAKMPRRFQTMVGFTDQMYMKKDALKPGAKGHYGWSADWNYFAEQLPGFFAFASRLSREDEGAAALTRVGPEQKALSFVTGVRLRPWDEQRNMLRMIYKSISLLTDQRTAETKKNRNGRKVSADNPTRLYLDLSRQIKRLEIERTRYETMLNMPLTKAPALGKSPKKGVSGFAGGGGMAGSGGFAGGSGSSNSGFAGGSSSSGGFAGGN